MTQELSSLTKPSSPPPAYTELPDSPSRPPPPSHSPNSSQVLAGPSAAAFPTHACYGPTPIAQQTQLVPYYDPHSSYALAEAGARARWRFMGAVLWALVIMLLTGFVTGWEAQQRIHNGQFGGWVRAVLGGAGGWSER